MLTRHLKLLNGCIRFDAYEYKILPDVLGVDKKRARTTDADDGRGGGGRCKTNVCFYERLFVVGGNCK